MNPSENTLSSVFSKNYSKIKENFGIGSRKHGIEFDSDIFSETYIRCNETIGNKCFDCSDSVIKYYWASFMNGIRRKFRKPKYKPTFIGINETTDAIDEETDTEARCCICDIILSSVLKKFGDRLYNAWYLHYAGNKSYNYISNLPYYKGLNLHDEFRKIMKYIRTSLIKNNVELQILLNDLQEK